MTVKCTQKDGKKSQVPQGAPEAKEKSPSRVIVINCPHRTPVDEKKDNKL